MNEKRKIIVVSTVTKLQSLKQLDTGEAMQQLPVTMLGRVTVGDWKRKRRELKKKGAVIVILKMRLKEEKY